MPGVLILILAAGASARMGGRDKLLELVDGQPLLARQAAMAGASGAEVLITLPPDRPDRRAVLAGIPGVSVVDLPDAGEGMAASIRFGADAARQQRAAGLMILPADMPEITAGDIAALIGSFDGQSIMRATSVDGIDGHPVIFPPAFFAALSGLKGDQGARDVLVGQEVLRIALPGAHALTDLDTPEDWADWRAGTGR